MNRTEYKNNFGREHYERINLVVPKGMKDIIKALASSKGMSVNAYMQDLVRKDQCGLFDTMQIAEKNREMISGITGNMHDGYDIIFKDGHSCHCRIAAGLAVSGALRRGNCARRPRSPR